MDRQTCPPQVRAGSRWKGDQVPLGPCGSRQSGRWRISQVFEGSGREHCALERSRLTYVRRTTWGSAPRARAPHSAGRRRRPARPLRCSLCCRDPQVGLGSPRECPAFSTVTKRVGERPRPPGAPHPAGPLLLGLRGAPARSAVRVNRLPPRTRILEGPEAPQRPPLSVLSRRAAPGLGQSGAAGGAPAWGTRTASGAGAAFTAPAAPTPSPDGSVRGKRPAQPQAQGVRAGHGRERNRVRPVQVPRGARSSGRGDAPTSPALRLWGFRRPGRGGEVPETRGQGRAGQGRAASSGRPAPLPGPVPSADPEPPAGPHGAPARPPLLAAAPAGGRQLGDPLGPALLGGEAAPGAPGRSQVGAAARRQTRRAQGTGRQGARRRGPGPPLGGDSPRGLRLRPFAP